MGNEILYMKRAIELANQGSGFVNPGPLEGAVIVKAGKIIGEAYSSHFQPSLPPMIKAIQNTYESTEGAEVYLNIEPQLGELSLEKWRMLLRKTGIKKVYIGLEIPKLKASDSTIEVIKAAEIEVVKGPLEEACEEQNEIFLHYHRTGRPFVFVKWAMTLDGKLATITGDSKWISSEDSLQFVHRLRQRVAAILVGEGTVKQDDPLLTTRLTDVAVSHPLRVIISKQGQLPDNAQVLSVTAEIQTLVIVSTACSEEQKNRLSNRGVQVVTLPESKGHIDFKEIVKLLGERGIDSLYIEGGSSVLGSAFESGIVNKVYTAIAPKIVGGKAGVTPVGGKGIERMNDALVLKKVSHEIIGQDVIIKGYLDTKIELGGNEND